MASLSIRRVRSKHLYRGRVADLYLETFRTASGGTFLRETIRHPTSVVILPVLSGGRVFLIRQYRHAVGRTIYEIPAGTTEPREPLLACAKRELEEETGHAASHWQRLCQFYPAPGISTERMVLYRATGLKRLPHPAEKDPDEFITLQAVSAQKAIRLVRENRIIDAKSIIGLLWGLERVNWQYEKVEGRL